MKCKSLMFCLVILAVLLLAGCDEYAPSSAAPPPAGAALELAPASHTLVADEVQITIRLVTDELLSGYAEYLDLSEFVDGDLRIMFTSNMLVRGFSILALGYEDGEPYEERVLIAQKELLPDRPLVVTWTEDRGISFVDESGATRQYVLEIQEAENEPFSLREF